jgi:TatD DNase family protein
MIVNLHTHFKLPVGQTGLVSHPVQLEFHPEPGQYYSTGLHPWSLNEAPNEEWFSLLEQLAVHPQVLAVGECGLDRSIETPPDQQEAAFIRQVEIAEKYSNPIILHAVRTWYDLIRIKKNRTVNVAWILHGYNGNAETTRQLIRQDFYFSFGTALLKDQEKLNQSLRMIPLDRLFFETDESMVPIESIYIFASAVLKLSITELKETVCENFQMTFKRWENGRNEQL